MGARRARDGDEAVRDGWRCVQDGWICAVCPGCPGGVSEIAVRCVLCPGCLGDVKCVREVGDVSGMAGRCVLAGGVRSAWAGWEICSVSRLAGRCAVCPGGVQCVRDGRRCVLYSDSAWGIPVASGSSREEGARMKKGNSREEE